MLPLLLPWLCGLLLWPSSHSIPSGLINHQKEVETLEIGVDTPSDTSWARVWGKALLIRSSFLGGTKVTCHTCILTLSMDYCSDKPLFGEFMDYSSEKPPLDYLRAVCWLRLKKIYEKNHKAKPTNWLFILFLYFSPQTIPRLKCNKIYIITSSQASDTVNAWRQMFLLNFWWSPGESRKRSQNEKDWQLGLEGNLTLSSHFTKKVLFGLWGMVSDSCRVMGIPRGLGEHLGCQFKPSWNPILAKAAPRNQV